MKPPFPQAEDPSQGWSLWLHELLSLLADRFGPRNWWPSAAGDGRAEPFEMIAGAILVQNTTWVSVERALRALNDAGLLAPEPLGRVPLEELEQLIRPTGYFRQKALKLKGLVRHLEEYHGGDLAAMLGRPLPDLRAELLGIRGIGPETCDCILNYAAGYPVMAMDAYTQRIFSRLGIFPVKAGYQEMQAFFHQHLPADTELLGEYHAQIDTLGNRVCLKARPRCGECPLHSICRRVGVEEAKS